MSRREVRALYSVSEVCRILRPGMTPRKVHYWLHTELLGELVRLERRGTPTLLSFDQLLKVAVLQRLRDDLRFSLQSVRSGLTWMLQELTDENWGELQFYRTGSGQIGVRDRHGKTFAVGGQGFMPELLPKELTAFVLSIRQQWESGVVPIRGFDLIVSDVEVMGGSPVIKGTRIETSFLAHVARETDVNDLVMLFEHVSRQALGEALRFEGIAA